MKHIIAWLRRRDPTPNWVFAANLLAVVTVCGVSTYKERHHRDMIEQRDAEWSAVISDCFAGYPRACLVDKKENSGALMVRVDVKKWDAFRMGNTKAYVIERRRLFEDSRK